MRLLALALLLCAAPLSAADRLVPAHLPKPIAPSAIAPLLLPASVLPVAAGRAEFYPPHSDFAGNVRHDELFVGIKTAEQLDAAARALSPSHPEAARKLLERDMKQGGKTPLSIFIPEAARGLTGAEPECAGPNCFNATAIYHGQAEELDHMMHDSAADMLFDGFRPLAPGEKLAFGDVMAVHTFDRDEGDELQHTMVYAGGKYVWHKASWHQADPWTFESLADALHPYTRPRRNAPRVDLRLYRKK